VQGVTGYVFAGLLLVVVNWLFWSDLFLTGQADLGPYWSAIAFMFIIFIPALSMGLIAEERENGTLEVILSLPVDETQLMIGKFFGGAAFMVLTMALTLPTIATLYWLGAPDTGVVVGSFLGTVFLGLGYLSVGLLVSTCTSQPMVAFLASIPL